MPALSLEQVRNLCMRRGFVFPGSAAYGGLGSFWDYGPLGVEMLNNIKQAWWHDAVYERDDMEGVDAAILMSRKVWQHSGHEATFSDPLVDNMEGGRRYRLDKLLEAQTTDVIVALSKSLQEVLLVHKENAEPETPIPSQVEQLDASTPDCEIPHLIALLASSEVNSFLQASLKWGVMIDPISGDPLADGTYMTYVGTDHTGDFAKLEISANKPVGDEGASSLKWEDIWQHQSVEVRRRWRARLSCLPRRLRHFLTDSDESLGCVFASLTRKSVAGAILQDAGVVDPANNKVGMWTQPRHFNLMFQSHVGPVSAAPGTDEESAARVYMRPETAQGIFMNFAHVQRSMARKVPFGIAQIGKAFRNEITPGNFIFRTREFEQMEIEFFIKPEQFVQEGEKTDEQWHQDWIDRRFHWWLKLATPPSAGNAEMEHIEQRFRKRAQTADELAHYAKATTDIEYLFPGSLGWGEIEGVANRTDFDLTAHSKDIPEDDLKRLKLEDNKDSNEKFDYFDPDAKKRYVPWVIEPSAGVTRAMLTFLCEAYDEEFVKEPSKQDIDQIKSDAAMIKNNAEKKIKQAEKDIAAGKEAKHDPVQVREFLDKLEDVVARLPESLGEVLITLDHPGAQNLEPVKKFRPPTEKFMDEISRTVLRLHPRLAPIKLAVFPLKKNNAGLVELAQKIQRTFQKRFRTIYDDSAGIGKLYRRQDEIGTPYCITVDFESLEDGTVTVRERDTMSQERVPVDTLHDYLLPRLELG